MVRYRIVIGVKSHIICEKLINFGTDLTLQKALDITCLNEQSTTQAGQISGEDTFVHVIHKKKRSLRNQTLHNILLVTHAKQFTHINDNLNN